MYKVKVYIEEQEVELFKDETISLNSSVQNIQDISKIFTDYTQSFTIPASNVNNKLFEHWYNVDITGGFSAAIRKLATIELNFLPFRTGFVQLNSVQMKNNKPYSYKITFIGDLLNLSNLFGEDVLNDLDGLDAYNHNYTSNQVKSGIQGTSLESGNIIYPLISSVNWTWDSQGTTLSDTDILYDSVTPNTYGIVWNEMKPALKIARIIDAIESKYSLAFTSTLFGSTDFEKIYMWCSPSKEVIEVYGSYTHVICNNEISDTAGSYDPITGEFTLIDTTSHKYSTTIDAASGYEEVLYSVAFYINGSLHTEVTNQIGTSGLLINYTGTVGDVVTIYVKAQSNFNFNATFDSIGQFSADVTGDSISVTGYVYMSDKTVSGVFHKGIMPDIKVGDFLSGIIKMFNMAIVPTSSTAYKILTLEEWYAAGNVIDINEYAFADKHTVTRPDLNRLISFKYEETETILGEQYREVNSIGYGDLEAEFTYDGGTLEIQLPFENPMGERLSSVNDGAISDIHVYKVIDKDLEVTETKPILFYLKGQTSLSTGVNGLSFANDTGTLEEIIIYNNIGQENALTDGAITGSLNFGSEVSTWTYSSQTESLYSNYWQDYVSDLYDSTRRVFNYKAVLPLNILTQIQLNDILIIREKAYIINTMKINLTSGITNFELLNNIGSITGVPVPAAPTSLTLTEGTI